MAQTSFSAQDMITVSQSPKPFKETEPLQVPAQYNVLLENQADTWLHKAMQQ